MTQDEVNQQEWGDPENWSGPRWLSVYFSKKDSRTWVPKQVPGLGATLNLGRTAGVWWLAGIMTAVPVTVAVVVAVLSVGMRR